MKLKIANLVSVKLTFNGNLQPNYPTAGYPATFACSLLVVGNPPNKPLSTDLLPPQCIHRFLCSFQKGSTFYYTLRIWLDYTLRQHCGHDI